MVGQVEFITPRIAIDNGNTTVSLRDQEFIYFAPSGHPIVKRLARENQYIVRIVELIESSAQAILMRHQQIAMERHQAQPQVPNAGYDKLRVFHYGKSTTIYAKKQHLRKFFLAGVAV